MNDTITAETEKTRNNLKSFEDETKLLNYKFDDFDQDILDIESGYYTFLPFVKEAQDSEIVTKEKYEQLSAGMSAEELRCLLGAPLYSTYWRYWMTSSPEVIHKQIASSSDSFVRDGIHGLVVTIRCTYILFNGSVMDICLQQKYIVSWPRIASYVIARAYPAGFEVENITVFDSFEDLITFYRQNPIENRYFSDRITQSPLHYNTDYPADYTIRYIVDSEGVHRAPENDKDIFLV